MSVKIARLVSASFLVCFLVSAQAGAIEQNSAKAFAFVSPDYIITAEVAGSHSFVLNFINLSDYVIVVQPNEFIYKGSSGRHYIGQVFDEEHQNSRGETLKYTASTLLRSRTYSGLTILGLFLEQQAIVELSIRIGSKRFYLVPLDPYEFEILAAKIMDIDLEGEDPRAELFKANLENIGTVRVTDGGPEWDRDWEGLLSGEGINPPKIIESPSVLPTPEAVQTATYGAVRLSAVITQNGGVQNLQVEKGLGRGLDERALDAVKNSWLFLPATANGEVLETLIKFDVRFPPPEPQPRP